MFKCCNFGKAAAAATARQYGGQTSDMARANMDKEENLVGENSGRANGQSWQWNEIASGAHCGAIRNGNMENVFVAWCRHIYFPFFISCIVNFNSHRYCKECEGGIRYFADVFGTLYVAGWHASHISRGTRHLDKFFNKHEFRFYEFYCRHVTSLTE